MWAHKRWNALKKLMSNRKRFQLLQTLYPRICYLIFHFFFYAFLPCSLSSELHLFFYHSTRYGFLLQWSSNRLFHPYFSSFHTLPNNNSSLTLKYILRIQDADFDAFGTSQNSCWIYSPPWFFCGTPPNYLCLASAKTILLVL